MVKVSDLFEIKYGDSFSRVADYEAGRTPVIKSTASNNGVHTWLNIEPNYKKVITVARTGSVGISFFHAYSCYVTDDCMVLLPKKNFLDKELLLFSSIISMDAYKYNYARKVTPKRLGNTMIPSHGEFPDWIESIQIPKKPSNEPFHNNTLSLLDKSWAWFKYNVLFEIKKGKRLTKNNIIKGSVPFIGSIDSNNGYREYINCIPLHTGNTITVNYNGSVGEAFYQPEKYWASDDCNILYSNKLNVYIGMFLVTIIRLEKFRFNYGRKWHHKRMKDSLIKLPIDSKGEPDWQFMEDYIKSLPYSSNL